MKNKLYKTSEFAALCGVTKHTLYHYDEIGLLCPKVVADNGYRFYTIEQYEKFLLISTFKMLGTPLGEIQSYFEKQDAEYFLHILKNKLIDVNKERKRLEKAYHLLSDTISTINSLENVEMGKINIMDCEEEYFIATPALPPAECTDDSDVIKRWGEHLQYCNKLEYVTNTLGGEIIIYHDILQGNYSVSFYISKAYKKTSDSRLHIKPKGKYAVLYYNGSYNSINNVYRSLKEHCDKMGFVVAGNIYQEDFCSNQSSDGCVMKISMQIM